jgi:uncharacterized protein YbaR (Trm112 family)
MSEDATITGPCQHPVPFLDSVRSVDDFVCPVCGLWWGIEQAKPVILPTGFAMPGKRTVVIRGDRMDRINIQIAAIQSQHAVEIRR